MRLISGVVDKLIDKLPAWAKPVLVAVTLLGSVYCVVRYGFLSFVLHVIFRP